MPTPLRVLLLSALALLGCSRKDAAPAAAQSPVAATQVKSWKVGLVTDVGGRGDQSFNDSALRGLEVWAAGSVEQVARSLPHDLAARNPAIAPLPVTPLVLQSKSQEDYEPNLQLLVDQGAVLAVGTGFLLENAVEAVAKRNLNAKFLLIDSPILDEQGKPASLPNVRTVVFREEEGSFLAGALAGLVTKTGKVGFVGGMQIPLIRKFEAGFRAGVMTTNPAAAGALLSSYTGSFDNVGAGKQVAQDLLAKGADVVFHAAGSDGLGVIKAVQEAHQAGRSVYVIGVDSDQAHLAPEVVLTSMVKRVDLAVYLTIRDLVEGKLAGGDQALGLKEGGVALAEVTLDFPGKAAALARVEALRAELVAGKRKAPSNLADLASLKAAP